MVIDSSALVAIFLGEPERDAFIAAIERDPVRIITAPTLLETAMVLSTKLEEASLRELDLFVGTMRAEIVSFSFEDQRVARRAFLTYGKGRHPAALNFGDCISYAAAVTRGEPLLFKGADFSQTDVTCV
jgi:ribonuclease VapC